MQKATAKRIVCLANSTRPGGRCLAGKEVLSDCGIGVWVRPVSDQGSEAVSQEEMRLQDGNLPQVLDVIDVPVLSRRPKNHQRENWLLGRDTRWKKVERISNSELEQCLDPVGSLWLNGYSSNGGYNDRIPDRFIDGMKDSLRFIKVDNLSLQVVSSMSQLNSGRSLKGEFWYNNSHYLLGVTDPVYEQRFLRSHDERMLIGEGIFCGSVFLTISLAADPYHGHTYKLIAAIIQP